MNKNRLSARYRQCIHDTVTAMVLCGLVDDSSGGFKKALRRRAGQVDINLFVSGVRSRSCFVRFDHDDEFLEFKSGQTWSAAVEYSLRGLAEAMHRKGLPLDLPDPTD